MAAADDIPYELAALFKPQVEQLGMRLERCGRIWAGEASGGVAEGSMWLCAPTPHCLVLCHDVTPLEDMPLFEGSQGPYACACAMGDDAVICSRDCGLPVKPVGAGDDGRRPRDVVATFVERGPRSLSSHLLAGRTYRSRSIILLPEFFEDLERRYPGEYRGVFATFEEAGGAGAEAAIRRALDDVPARAPLHPGGELQLLSTVSFLVASLASEGPSYRAKTNSEGLAIRVKELIAEAFAKGSPPSSIDDVASRLFMSRSHLCSVFRHETGMSIGSYIRSLRLERARSLLEDGRFSVAEISRTLGYPSPSAFTHAFSDAVGMSPRAWRTMRNRG